MATTPEELFVEGLKKSPQSPSVFLDVFSPKPDDRSEGCHHVPSDMVLSYISRMLMEDDIDDKPSDHPALLQVQQPFAQILSSPSFGSNHGDTEGANDLLQDSSGDERTLHLALSKSTYAVGAFLKGMKEANMLLPIANNGFRRDELVNQMVRESSNHSGAKKRYASDDHIEEEEARRTSKSLMMIKEPKDICAHEMLEDMMLRGTETFIIRCMEKLRIAMANEAEKSTRKGSTNAVANVVDIRTTLILCAQAVAANDDMTASKLLKQIKQHASETGDVTQRLAQCFARGLEARLEGMGSQVRQLRMADRLELLEACNLLTAAWSFNRVVLLFSTMTILQAMVGKGRLHIVDYGMRYGFHWADLLRLLASREGGPPKVKITTIGHPNLRPRSKEQIEETGYRLSKCAHEFGVPFNFYAIRKKWEEVSIKDLNTDAGEVLIVNDLMNFNTLMDESIFFDDPCPKDIVLHNIRKMRPAVFIQSIVNSSYGPSYLSRFREVVFYFTAIFDILDATIPRDSKLRVVLEQDLFGRSVLNAIACEGTDLMERPEKYKQWHARNQRAGLRQLPLKPSIVNVLKDKVMRCYHRDFLICEDGQWLLQGWMGRILFAQSTWVADDTS
ncbi:scarecrow-like protein 34 [Setaria viridis]|uniref:scarecrow-like protein 34 n=1 Tax=Setaria viridis TaxID=4556 RepID=UPI00149331D7|nr:scarecrow-like protein 33 [Setaria viridis]